MRVPVDGLLPPCRHAIACAEGVPPPRERLVEHALPPLAAPRRPTPEECDAAVLGDARKQALRNRVAIESMERVPDRDEVEGLVERHGLGCRGSRMHVRDSETLRLVRGERDHLRFLVDGPDLRDVRRQRERDLTRATGQVEQPARRAERDAGAEIVEQVRRVGRPESVVVLGCALEQVLVVLELGHDIIVACRATPAHSRRAGPRPSTWPMRRSRGGFRGSSRRSRIRTPLNCGAQLGEPAARARGRGRPFDRVGQQRHDLVVPTEVGEVLEREVDGASKRAGVAQPAQLVVLSLRSGHGLTRSRPMPASRPSRRRCSTRRATPP